MRMIHFLQEQCVDKNPFWRDDLRDRREEVKREIVISKSNALWTRVRQRMLAILHRQA